METDDESVLKQVIALLGGMKRPCAYTPEEMSANLREADGDFNTGRVVAHEELLAEYGL